MPALGARLSFPLLLASLLLSPPVLAADPAGPPPAVPGSREPMTKIVADLEAFARAEMAKQKVPGLAFAIVQDDKLVHAKGYGVKKLGGTDPVGAHTVFEAGSTTKAFTSALVGTLVDEGKLKWSDRVVDHLPAFKMNDPWVTKEFRVDDLMAQRSGMPPYALDTMATLGWSRRAIADAVAFVEPVYSFRSDFSYVNTLWLHASFLVEKAGGLSWENAMARRILGPLGMAESTVDPEVVPRMEDVATGHLTLADGSLWAIPPGWTWASWIDPFGPAGNLRSNVVDMSKWARMNLSNGTFEGKRILSPETVTFLQAPRTAVRSEGKRTFSYALGWIHDSRSPSHVVWHNGGTSGMHSLVALYPAAGVGLVVLTNSVQNKVPEAMDEVLYGLLFPGAPSPDAAGRSDAAGKSDAAAPATPSPARAEPPSRPKGAAPPLPLGRYAGSYSNPAYGTVTVREKDGALVLTIGPKKIAAPMTHFAGNVFAFSFPSYPESETYATFEVLAGAPAARVQLDLAATVKGGWFERTGP